MMSLKINSEKKIERVPMMSNICPECGEAQVFKWDNEGGGKNIILTSFSHKECYKKYWKNIKDFDYEVTIKSSELKNVA
jgi:hypothetical protein